MQKNMANCDDSRCLAHWTIESSSYDRANQGNHTSLRMTLGHNTILGLVLVSIAKWNQLHRPLQRIQLCSDEANHSRNGIIHRQTDAVKPLPKPILFRNGNSY